MNYPDWTEYDAGTLSPSERAAIEALLETDAGARADYAAYREYRATLRHAVLSDSSFSLMQFDFPSPRRSFGPRRWVGLAALGAAALAIGVFGPRWLNPSPSPTKVEQAAETIAKLSTQDPIQAHDFVSRNVSFQVPTYRLNQVARMTGAECGKDWGAYLYNCGSKKAKLIIRPVGYRIPNAKETLIGGTTFYESGNSVGWHCTKCSYEITGCDSETRWMLAKAAAKELFGKL